MENNHLLNLSDTCVQHDEHLRPSRETQVSDATDTSACQPTPAEMRICLCCGRKLPLSQFYVNRRQHRHDSYCKECRKTFSRLTRKKKEAPARVRESAPADGEEPKPRRTAITDVEDREERMGLILNALQTVRNIYERKKKRERQEEYLRFLKSGE